jgi:hypothetical protein
MPEVIKPGKSEKQIELESMSNSVCKTCGCKFAYKASEPRVGHTTYDDFGHYHQWYVNCPHCKRGVCVKDEAAGGGWVILGFFVLWGIVILYSLIF